MCQFLPHPPPCPPPPTTPPLSSISYLSDFSNTIPIAPTFLLYLLSYPTSDFFSSTTYPSSSPYIFSSRILSRILIYDVTLVLFLQNHVITFIDIPLPQLLLNQLLILTFICLFIHHPICASVTPVSGAGGNPPGLWGTMHACLKWVLYSGNVIMRTRCPFRLPPSFDCC